MPQYRLTADQAGDIPYLLLADETLPADAPLVLVLHGLGGSKEKVLPTVYSFAKSRFRVAALDAREHGERLGAAQREARLAASYVTTLYEIISGTAHDVSSLLDHLRVDHAAIHGISLGGYVTFSALLSEERLAVASVAMGSPDWLGPLRAMGLDLQQPAFAPILRTHPLDRADASYPPRPLLMLHGLQDDVVPVDGVQALHKRLKPAYADQPERLELVLYPDLGHLYTPDMLERSIEWTRRFL